MSTEADLEPDLIAGGRIPLSMQQEFLCLFDKGDDAGPFGPRYHVVGGWRLRGELDIDTLQKALDDVVARHEVLRTSIVRGERVQYQKIAPPSSPQLLVRDLSADDPDSRDRRAEEFLNEIESGTISVREQPLLRAVLGRFDDHDAVLVPVVHHTAADGWSMHVIMRDLADFYAARRGHGPPELLDVCQYQEYAVRQRASAGDAAAIASREYWRKNLHGAKILAIPTDRLRSAEPTFTTSWHRFSIEEELRSATAEVAVANRSSPFMVLLAAFKVLVHEMTGATDIVVPTFTPGRGQARIQNAVGSFFNFLPLRTEIAGCQTFRDVVGRTRSACLKSYSNEVPLLQILEEAPDLMRPAAVDGLATCVFQVVQSPFMMHHETIGDLEYSAMRRRTLSQDVGSDIPDGALWWLELDRAGDIVGCVGYSSNLFDESTIIDMVSAFRRTLRKLVTCPDAPLSWS